MYSVALFCLLVFVTFSLFSITGLYIAETMNEPGDDDSQYIG